MSWKYKVLKFIVRNKKLTPGERLASRIGYMGAGFLVAAQWTVEPKFIHSWFLLCVSTGSKQKTMELSSIKH